MSAHHVLHFGGALMDPTIPGYVLGNGYRIYLTPLMRFTAPDSASPFDAGGPHPYAYCGNDPINRADPTGHMDLDLLEIDRLERDVADSSRPRAPTVGATGVVPPETDRPIATAPAVRKAWPSFSGPKARANSAPIAGPPPSRLPSFGRIGPNTGASANDADSVPEWRRKYSPPANHERRLRIDAAKALLGNPPGYDLGPTFKVVPQHARADRGYDATGTIGWTVALGAGNIEVFAHVHYAWNGSSWDKIAGNAWIPGVKDWQHATTPAIVRLAPVPSSNGPW